MVGDLVILADVSCHNLHSNLKRLTLYQHLNLAGLAGIHPLRGPNIDAFGVRFPPLSNAYSLELRRKAHRIWEQSDFSAQGRSLHEGVYAFVGGPR